MSLFDRTFLITTGITAVICGALFYYFNNRMRELEIALVKQNQVLSSFIANVQQEFRGGRNSNELASPEALKAVYDSNSVGVSVINDNGNDNNQLVYEKIVISDSECDSDDSDSESESESDSDDECEKVIICDLSFSDENKNDIKVVEIDLNKDISTRTFNMASNNMTPINMTSINMSSIKLEVLSDESDDESDDDALGHSDNDFEIVNIESSLENILNVVKVTEYEAKSDAVEEKEVKLEDLKVDELRKMVLDKDLVKKEEAKKLKKNELLALLKKTLLEKV